MFPGCKQPHVPTHQSAGPACLDRPVIESSQHCSRPARSLRSGRTHGGRNPCAATCRYRNNRQATHPRCQPGIGGACVSRREDHHRCPSADTVIVQIGSGDGIPAKIIASEPAADIALLKLERIPPVCWSSGSPAIRRDPG